MPPRGRGTGRAARPGNRGPRSTGPSDRPGITGGPTAGDLAAHRARLRVIIEPAVAKSGYDLEDVVVMRMGRRHVVRVTVDRDGGVPLDDVAELARDISAALDEAEEASGEFIAGEYQLEVSSPGVDRPLALPRHWRRNVGRLVKVKIEGKTVTARVIAADDDAVTLDVDGATRVAPYADLGKGRVEVEFGHADEAGDAVDTIVDFDDESGDDDDAEADDES